MKALVGFAFALLLTLQARAADTLPEAVIETSLGKITVKLFADKAPGTVSNFLEYAKAGFYDNVVFHRVIPGFMVQGGGYTADLNPKPGLRAPIKNEAGNGLSNKRGTLAMARTGVVDSATAQFFINVADNTRLDHTSNDPAGFGYCVFGEVIGGMDVVEKIKSVETVCPSSGGAPCTASLPPNMRDVPKTPVVIKKITRK